MEAKTLRRFAKGPGNWIRPTDLHNLKNLAALHFQMTSVKISALAGKMRVIYHEGLDVVADADSIRDTALDHDTLGRADKAWFHAGICQDLASAKMDVRALGISTRDVL